MHLSVDTVPGFVNHVFKNKEPWQIAAMTSTATLATVWLWTFVCQDESLLERGKKQLFKLARYVPSIRDKINKELVSINENFEKDVVRRLKEASFIVQLPKSGLKNEKIMNLINQSVHLGDYDWEAGRVSGAVYRTNNELAQLMGNVYAIASYTNPLHPDVFPGICKLEAEVVRIACHLFNGDKASCGTMTTGGTESILLACKAYRDYAREAKGIRKPEIVLPVTAHAAFDKAAQYLNIKIRSVPVNPQSFTVCVKAMRKSITKNTIMLVGSAPNFPYGTMDNIEAISELGVKYDIPVHVDACLGGFLACFMSEAGYALPPFDFRLPGVTSISADTHKYGYAPKGSSLILYRNKKYRHHQYTITTDWPGGIYGSPTINGSRAGGIIATCWATLMYYGRDEYVKSTKKIIEITRYVERKLSEALSDKGWNLNTLQFPCGIHICITHVHTEPGVADQFLEDVDTELEMIMETRSSPVEGKLAMYGMSQSIPDRSVVGDFTKCFLDSMYYTAGNETQK
ncbi:PREDICTED: sphingosine-1-phosphate lyase isoform X3 [Vollenhovia emeryi]|uniref:sphingosine-1-phosphate lyase isoform X3 n=1 Tax=Vollenhovia emeryi TaxID=411798 RepID=UPI0005F57DE2|nr:PREDICTED: sphingosine-1-phosphate lyase isoform X3 [Vollenhovia emeryi]